VSGFELTTDAAQLAAKLTAAGRLVAELEPVNQRAGELVHADAHAPRRSGRLGASVRVAAAPDGFTIAGHTPYWTFVHWGAPRRHVRAQPWLLSALRVDTAAVIQLYADHLADTVATIGE
jgi:hypothetical protein